MQPPTATNSNNSPFRLDWPVPPHVHTAVSTRAGGVSEGGYASLNIGAHVGDSAAAVAENRRRLVRQFHLPGEPSWLNQVHETGVVEVNAQSAAGIEVPTADAAFTRDLRRVCCVMTADCLPVFFADQAGSVVGLAHAGWRGLAAGILERTIQAMDVAPSKLMAAFGPAISAAAFEVGDEVRAAFMAANSHAAGAFSPNARGRWQADLYALARLTLASAGVTRVYGGGVCTYGESERFFSHRRSAPCGRMASMIWLSE